jgi:hypothetical protein
MDEGCGERERERDTHTHRERERERERETERERERDRESESERALSLDLRSKWISYFYKDLWLHWDHIPSVMFRDVQENYLKEF